MCAPVPATVSAAPHAEPGIDPPVAGLMVTAGNSESLNANLLSGRFHADWLSGAMPFAHFVVILRQRDGRWTWDQSLICKGAATPQVGISRPWGPSWALLDEDQ